MLEVEVGTALIITPHYENPLGFTLIWALIWTGIAQTSLSVLVSFRLRVDDNSVKKFEESSEDMTMMATKTGTTIASSVMSHIE